MRPAVFWPSASLAFVLGLALAAYGLLAMAGAAQGGAGEVLLYMVIPGALLAGAAVLAVLGRAIRAAYWRWLS